MKPLYKLLLSLLSFLVLSSCSCHPTLSHNRTNNIQCIDKEREALLKFKHGITSDDRGLLASWGTHIDCCQWHGVLCSNLTGHVVMLNLVGEYSYDGSDVISCLQGKVSPSLGDLNHLEHLNLSINAFHGEIPHQLGNLSKLISLDLKSSHGYFNVESLSWISRLTLLTYLDLSGADLSQLTNWMTIVTNLHSLRVLRMNDCQLPMKFPTSLSYVNYSSNLHTISLSKNYINDSSFFPWLFNLPRISTQLIYLDLSWNAFEVPVPREFENFHNLSFLSLSNNAFQGSIFKITRKLCNLRQLYLGANNFTDELENINQFLVNCKNNALLTLDLSRNNFWGAIPDSISLFSSLRELYLNNNKLNGEISQGIGQLTMLEKLDLSSNSFVGTVNHTHFLKLVNLRQLYLSDNPRLVVNTNQNWIPPFQLHVISLRSCELGPRFPKWLELQNNFSYFDISNTSIYDVVPVSFWSSLPSKLQYLDMSYNQFYGMLSNLPNISNAITIDLSSNLFEGVVPSGFTNIDYVYLNDNRFSDCSYILCPKITSTLSILDLSSNLFSGELPDCWMNFSQLTSLHLENNQFSGPILKSIGTLSNLRHLHLYNNSFSGPFPTTFESSISLITLNLGYNLFSGYIPPWIGNASRNLGVLILRKNHFLGEIPQSICQLNNLHILDLANNHISGVIPNCIGNFTAMQNTSPFPDPPHYAETFRGALPVAVIKENTIITWKGREYIFAEVYATYRQYIDLSDNELSGEIPSEISILAGLLSLDLSKNKLSGNIPLEIGNLASLELLYLSDNHITGKMSTSLGNLEWLDTFNVSNNNLSGEIPEGNQLQFFDALSYAGNPGLCGGPLPSCSKHYKPYTTNSSSVQAKDDDFGFFLGLCISVALGFIF